MLRRTLLLASLAGIGIGSGGLHAAWRPLPKGAATAAGEIGSRLPQFVVRDLQEQAISSAAFRDKVLLINFWATWCRPCEKEMPGYQELLKRYGQRGFAVVGLKLSTMKDTEDPIVFARKMGISYPLAVADEGLMRKFGGIEGLPTTMVYDRQGILRKKVIGFESTSTVESAIEPLLGEVH